MYNVQKVSKLRSKYREEGKKVEIEYYGVRGEEGKKKRQRNIEGEERVRKRETEGEERRKGREGKRERAYL